jgi:hypothetical protein
VSSEAVSNTTPEADVGEYCRRVEEHLTRVNEGQLVRVAGTGFDVVRAWALDGIPLSVACRGIDQKAERHRAGASRRPLRVEFCDDDVRALFDEWRRAVGVTSAVGDVADSAEAREPARRRSLAKHIDRAVEKLVRVGGRLELPDGFRDAVTRAIEELVVLRERAAHARGVAREALISELAAIDAPLVEAAREAAVAELPALSREAVEELAGYRDRLPADAWDRAVRASVDRLVRDRLGLPTLDADLH